MRFIEKANLRQLELKETTEFKSLSGLGIQGKIDDQEYLVGNLRMIKEANLDLSNYQEKVDVI